MFPAGGQIPSNQLFLTVSLARDRNGQVGDAKLYRVAGNSRTEVATRDQSMDPATATRVLVPTEPVAPGTKLLLEAPAPACRPDGALRAEFEVTDKADAPNVLGTVDLKLHHASLKVATTRGSCSEIVDAVYADLGVTLVHAAEPLADVIDYSLVLDGTPFSSFSADLVEPTDLGRGKDRVFAPCAEAPYLIGGTSLGMHRVQVRGTLPDGRIITSSEGSFELSCSATQPADEDAGLDAGGHEQNMSAASSGPSTFGLKDGCSVTLSSRSRAGWAFTALLALAALRRRRRQRTALRHGER